MRHRKRVEFVMFAAMLELHAKNRLHMQIHRVDPRTVVHTLPASRLYIGFRMGNHNNNYGEQSLTKTP